MQKRFAIARVNEAFSFCPPLTSLSTNRRPTAVGQFPIMRLTRRYLLARLMSLRSF
jgi:hypothetical protein